MDNTTYPEELAELRHAVAHPELDPTVQHLEGQATMALTDVLAAIVAGDPVVAADCAFRAASLQSAANLLRGVA